MRKAALPAWETSGAGRVVPVALRPEWECVGVGSVKGRVEGLVRVVLRYG